MYWSAMYKMLFRDWLTFSSVAASVAAAARASPLVMVNLPSSLISLVFLLSTSW